MLENLLSICLVLAVMLAVMVAETRRRQRHLGVLVPAPEGASEWEPGAGLPQPSPAFALDEAPREDGPDTHQLVFEWDRNTDAVVLFGFAAPRPAVGAAGIPATLLGWSRLIPRVDFGRLNRAIEECLVAGRPLRETIRVLGPDARLRRWDIRAYARNGNGRNVSLVGAAALCTAEASRTPECVAGETAEARRAQAELRDSEERFRIAARSSSDVIFEVDVETREIRRCEPLPETLRSGLHACQDLSSWKQMIHPEDLGRASHDYHQHVEHGAPYRSEYRTIDNDGSVRHWQFRGETFTDSSGRRRFVGAGSDITDRANADRALRVSEERFRVAAEMSSHLICEVDLIRRNAELYGQFGPELGFTREQLSGSAGNWLRWVHEEDRPGVMERLDSGEEQVEIEYRVVTPAGETRHWSHRCKPIRDESDAVIKAIVGITDITDRKRAECALQISQERFRIAAENASDIIYEWCLDDDRVQYFGRIPDGWGMTAEELPKSGNDWLQIVHAADRERVSVASQRLREGAAGVTIEYRVVLRGRVRDVVERASLLWRSTGTPKIIGTLCDITDRKRSDEALHRLAAIVRRSDDAIFSTTPEFKFASWNPGAERLFGYRFEEVAGRHVSMLVPEDRLPELRGMLQTLASGHSICAFETVRRRKDGGLVPVSLTLSPIGDTLGQTTGYSCIARDITTHKRAEAVLRESEERFRNVFESGPVGMVLVTLDGRMLRVNAAMCRLLGYEEAEMVGRSARAFTHNDDWDRTQHMLDAVRRGDDTDQIEKRYVRKDGEQVWGTMKASLIRNEHGEPLYIVGIVQDVTERKRVEAMLAYRSVHDVLTGLPNRQLLEDRLHQAVQYADRYGEMLALLYVDLDSFKLINDTLGHSIGDLLLQQVAYRLQSCERPHETLARLGGDEFMLVAPVDSREDAEAAAERLMHAFNRSYRIGGYDLFVTASIGICLYPEHGGDVTTLTRRADSAMYEAKRLGKRRHQFFTPELSAAASERLEIETSLRVALERNQFELHYQPQFRLDTNELVAFEALLRWNHPKLGQISPGKFIPVAEDTGLIVPIGHWVLEEVCRVIRHRLESGLRPVKLGINVSALQFARPDFVESIKTVLERTRVAPIWLEIEVTESVCLRDADDAAAKIDELRKLGITVALDDFGTGYSSFGYLQRLAIDRLKIDRSFVVEVGRAPSVLALLQAMATLGKTLGMRVVVEGIETQEQLQAIRSIGCDEAQGYLLGMPRPAGKTGLELLIDHVCEGPSWQPEMPSKPEQAVPGREC